LPPSEKGRIPTYLKIIIAIGAIALFGIFTLFVIGIVMFKDSVSPEHAAKIASEIVILPDPLPPGWHYGVGLDVGYQKIVNVQYRSGGKSHPLVQFSEISNPGHLSAKATADRLFTGDVAGVKFEPEARGEEMIGGWKAYYVRAHFALMNRQSATEVALIDLPGGRIMQIQSTEDGEETFDPKLVKPLLDCVKGFANR
jgi:hypothetical protein